MSKPLLFLACSSAFAITLGALPQESRASTAPQLEIDIVPAYHGLSRLELNGVLSSSDGNIQRFELSGAGDPAPILIPLEKLTARPKGNLPFVEVLKVDTELGKTALVKLSILEPGPADFAKLGGQVRVDFLKHKGLDGEKLGHFHLLVARDAQGNWSFRPFNVKSDSGNAWIWSPEGGDLDAALSRLVFNIKVAGKLFSKHADTVSVTATSQVAGQESRFTLAPTRP